MLGVILTFFVILMLIFIPKVYPFFLAMLSNYINCQFAHYVAGPRKELFSCMPELKKSLQTENLTILEIGAGSGTNFQFFPCGSSVIALEPNRHFQKYLRKNASSFSPDIEIVKILTDVAENMQHVADNSVCAVVSTIVMCSVKNVDAVLREVKRVLRPGGRFYFLEHVYCEEECFTQRMQELLDPLQVKFGNNCHLTRTLSENIDSAGFSEVQYSQFWARKLPRVLFLMKLQLTGTATK